MVAKFKKKWKANGKYCGKIGKFWWILDNFKNLMKNMVVKLENFKNLMEKQGGKIGKFK